MRIIHRVAPYTMTSPERISALIKAVQYLCENNIPGDIVECGVWRGGSSMAAALGLLEKHSTDREIWMLDTYKGMAKPGDEDVDLRGGVALERFESSESKDGYSNWCYATLDDVKRNLESTGYPSVKLHFIEGKVEDTLPSHAPQNIALLRLDTDWYESTLHELVNLWPRLVPAGICILDDYGHWRGARKAVDEYFEANKLHVFLNRIDYSGRLIVKPN